MAAKQNGLRKKAKTSSKITVANRSAGAKLLEAALLGTSIGALLTTRSGRRTVKQIYNWWRELFRTCDNSLRYPRAKTPFLIIAHRGNPSEEIENTMPSFRRAIEIDKANAIELDLCMTKDKVIVIWHDWDPLEIRALAREATLEPDVMYSPHSPSIDDPFCKPTHELTLAELREHFGYKEKSFTGERVEAEIPTLEEFLQYAAKLDQIRTVYFDLKLPLDLLDLTHPFMDEVYALIRKYQPVFECVYTTPEEDLLEALVRHNPHTCYALDVEPPPGIILDACEFTSVKAAIRFGNAYASTIHPKVSTIAPWTTFRRILECDCRKRDAHNATNPKVPIKRVVGCTINDAAEMRCLINIGIDGLITDKPGLLRQVAEEMGCRL